MNILVGVQRVSNLRDVSSAWVGNYRGTNVGRLDLAIGIL